MEGILEVQEADTQAIVSSAQPILLDFWAAWCDPRAFAPIFEKLAKNYGGEVLFAEINVDESPALAERYAIHPLPTVLLIRGGVAVERFAAGRLNNHLAETLSQHVGPVGLSH